MDPHPCPVWVSGVAWGVPAAWLIGGCCFPVAGCAQSASILWIVRIQTELDQLVTSMWVMVSDGGDCDATCDAHWVALDDCTSECLVTSARVPALGCRTPTPIGLCPMPGASAAGASWVDLWASVRGADSHLGLLVAVSRQTCSPGTAIQRALPRSCCLACRSSRRSCSSHSAAPSGELYSAPHISQLVIVACLRLVECPVALSGRFGQVDWSRDGLHVDLPMSEGFCLEDRH